jgi:hypothetical protein
MDISEGIALATTKALAMSVKDVQPESNYLLATSNLFSSNQAILVVKTCLTLCRRKNGFLRMKHFLKSKI